MRIMFSDRKFDGRVFEFFEVRESKASAKEIAKEYRKFFGKARVIKFYAVYTQHL